ncbi:flagellar protein FliI [Croceicoccus estronivorus]|uniref:FliI/YscN family ATPase n=1 Tax=Croceicoccus estronivorus TaxID=1172626 RepID=UPI0008333C4E|nr:FliI/YscN family ATPase [Croceicoccus estronivorus]OCC22935.1 flagellar protein FliI [Croceicoccus estronivorus]
MKAHPYITTLERAELARRTGTLIRIGSEYVEADGPIVGVGDYCEIEQTGRNDPIIAEVTAIEQERIRLLPFSGVRQLRLGARVSKSRHCDDIPTGAGFAGRAIDALANPLDGGRPILAEANRPRAGHMLAPLDRMVPKERLITGIRAIDALLPLGKGQRIGIFAASGVGKTSLIDQIAHQIESDRVILCLVGERGREVEKLWRTHLRERDGTRFTLVAATADESASLRVRAIDQALGLAEHWRDKGEHVLLIVDSITRVALALRELGLASGEPPTIRAFTPNVFSALPKIVERCGAVRHGGSITAIMTVLSETDDVDDPIVELMKSVLDGHIVLSRTLAEKRHFPAIDVARSVSRLASDLFSRDDESRAQKAHAALALYEEARPMIESGIYRQGNSAEIDQAIAWHPQLTAFLRQPADHLSSLDEAQTMLDAIVGGSGHA